MRTRAEDGVLEVVLDRPKANAIDRATSQAMNRAWQALRDDPELKVGILTGAGDRFFSAGWDLKAAAAGEGMEGDWGEGGFGGLEHPVGLLKPVIAVANGMAVGGGFEVLLGADLVVAEEHARFALMEVHHGILAESAAVRLPRRIPRAIAMELMLTGRWMDAAEAERWGLVEGLALLRGQERGEVLGAALELARDADGATYPSGNPDELIRTVRVPVG
ncbi:MAG: enoyl-CoA hydratase-related protein, partial [Actinomycetota bacterium]